MWRPPRVDGAVAIVAGVAFVVALAGPIPGTLSPVRIVPAVGVAVAAGLFAGDEGAVAATVGVLAASLPIALDSVAFVVPALATLTVALVAIRLWQPASALVADDVPEPGTVESLPTLALALAGAALPAAAVDAAARSLLVGTPFFVTAPDVLATYAASGVLVGGAAAILVQRLVDRRAWDHTTVASREPWGRSRTAAILAVSVAWLVAGSGIDLGFTLARLVPAQFYRARFGSEVPVAAFNWLQLLAQALLSLGALGLLYRYGAFEDVLVEEPAADAEPP